MLWGSRLSLCVVQQAWELLSAFEQSCDQLQVAGFKKILRAVEERSVIRVTTPVAAGMERKVKVQRERRSAKERKG